MVTTTTPSPAPSSARAESGRAVTIVALLLVALQVAWRGTAVLAGWFYADDYEFLYDADNGHLSLDYLLTPHDSQLMPGGVLLSWLVGQSHAFNWTFAALTTIGLQALASLACWWMLRTLFGDRPGILFPLAFYLFSPMTITAFFWWASALNQLPLQAAMFAVVGFHVRYLRSRRRREVVGAAAVLVLGLLFYVKVVLAVVPLVFVTLAFFGGNGLRTTLRDTVVRALLPWVAYAVVVGGYLGYYLSHAPSPLGGGDPIDYSGLLDTMIRTSFGVTMVGGPWRWSLDNPPLGQVDSPEWAVMLSWLAIVGWVAHGLRRGVGRWSPLSLVAVYLTLAFLLVATGRANLVGAGAGLELRYLADTAVVVTIAIALFHMRMIGESPAEPRAVHASPQTDAVTGLLVTGTVVVAVGAVWSNLTYARFWADDFPAKLFAKNAIAATAQEPLVVADAEVPELVMSVTSYPSNLPSHMLAPLDNRLRAVDVGTDILAFNESGVPYPAAVGPEAASLPGPEEGCGYRVEERAIPVEMSGSPDDYFWWASIGYLSSADGTLVFEHGRERTTLPVEQGLHRVIFRGQGAVAPLRLVTKTDGLTVCVDKVTAGPVVALEPLQ